jgi:hypothetical protein
MDAIHSSDTSVLTRATLRNVPEDGILQNVVYHGNIMLPLLPGNELIMSSVDHVKASCNMSKFAWMYEFA